MTALDASPAPTVPVLPLATGAWREGDPAGHRRFVDVGAVTLESGDELPDVRVAYETWGEFDGTNAVLVLHALTGDALTGAMRTYRGEGEAFG